jgi:hypothetical protein
MRLLPKGDERQGGFDPHSGAAVIRASTSLCWMQRSRNIVTDTH